VEGDANVTPNKLRLLALGPAVVCLALAGCTPSAATTPPTASPTSPAPPTTAAPTVSATPTVTATPTPTLDADQAAALDVVERYSAAMAKVRANPAKHDQYKIIDLIKPLAYNDVIQASLNGVRPWRDKGWRQTGLAQTITATASSVDRVDGTIRVTVAVCRDQRDVVVVGKDDKPLKASEQLPDFVRRNYELRRTESAKFRIYQSGGEEVASCAS
jgi:hypothetical protein